MRVSTAISAFPRSCKAQAEGAARTLFPFVDSNYRIRCMELTVLARHVQIPKRIHFVGLPNGELQSQSNSGYALQCLCSRSTDGHIRQAALRGIIGIDEAWVVPFVVLLAGEYVVEIIDDIVASVATLNRDSYSTFVRENRPLIRRVRSNAVSYWNCYYRDAYATRSSYPGLAFLNQIELWAS
jgi:hypothetical protein